MSEEGGNRVLEVVDWDRNFENSRSRGIENARWVAIPNRHDGLRYARLIKHKDGAQLFAAWILIVELASKCRKRGVLTHGDGSAITLEDMAEVTRAPLMWFEKAVSYLVGIRWMRYLPVTQLSAGCQAGDSQMPYGYQMDGEQLAVDRQGGDGRVTGKRQAAVTSRARRMEGRKEGMEGTPYRPPGGLESEVEACASSRDSQPEKKEGADFSAASARAVGAAVAPFEPADVRGRWFLERVCKIFGRDPGRMLGYEGQQALPDLLNVDRAVLEQECLHVAWFHGLPADDQVNELKARRTSVEKLLAHWSEEVDRARGYAKKTGAAILAEKKEARPEPKGWREAARSLSDDPDRCVLPERFTQLTGDMQRDVVRILAEKKEGG